MTNDSKVKSKICKKCGKPFMGATHENFCNECVRALLRNDGQKQEAVRNYIRERGEVNDVEIMQEFGVTRKFLKQMMDSGYFIGRSKNRTYPCANCGKPITEGAYCYECFLMLREEIRNRSERMFALKNHLLSRLNRRKGILNILVVDPDSLNLDIMKYIIEKGLAPHQIFSSDDMKETLNLLRAKRIDLIILDDTVSTSYDSLEILRRVREGGSTKSIPVVMLSALAAKNNMAIAMSLGISEYIIKPCDPKILIERVKKILDATYKLTSEKAPEATEVETRKILRILLIDDKEKDLHEENDILKSRFDCEIITARNGVEALYRLQEIDVSLILVSMEMEFMDGFEFLSFVVDDEFLRHFPVVVMTESTNVDVLNGIKKTFAKGYVRKPHFSEEGLELIEKILDSQQ